MDSWLLTLRTLVDAEPVPDSLEAAIATLASVGIDVAQVIAEATKWLHAPKPDWHPSDWRHTHPQFPSKYALALHAYTLQEPKIYAQIGAAMHDPNRGTGPGKSRQIVTSVDVGAKENRPMP